MAVTSNLFQATLDQALQGKINWPTDTIKMALLTASATPSLSSWVHYSDLTNEVAAGSGYTTGGVTLASKTNTETVANSWTTAWAATTAYNAGDVIRPGTGNGFLYVCVTAGTSAGTTPTFPTVVGQTVTDGGAVWSCLGESITVWSSAAAQWTSATFSAQYGVIYDAATGVGTTEPLICLVNFGTTASPVSGTLTVTPPSLGWFITSPA
jgi:hypothetical protein